MIAPMTRRRSLRLWTSDHGPLPPLVQSKYCQPRTSVGGLWATILRARLHEMRPLPFVMKTLNEAP
jgi:hypothetical protein